MEIPAGIGLGLNLILPDCHAPSVDDLEGFGAIAGMAHTHNGHPFGSFPCPCCRGIHWRPGPDGDFGILIHDNRGRLVEESEAVRRLLVP